MQVSCRRSRRAPTRAEVERAFKRARQSAAAAAPAVLGGVAQGRKSFGEAAPRDNRFHRPIEIETIP